MGRSAGVIQLKPQARPAQDRDRVVLAAYRDQLLRELEEVERRLEPARPTAG